MLTLAAIALFLPAAYNAAAAAHAAPRDCGRSASRSRSCCWPSTRCSWCSRCAPTGPVRRARVERRTGTTHTSAPWSTAQSRDRLAAATALVAWVSEILVGAIEPTAHEFGLSNVFVGVFVVAILGNAAEHATASPRPLKNRMDLSLSIAIGSSVQVALFVAPVLVLASLVIGPAPMDLAFSAGLVLTRAAVGVDHRPGRRRRTLGLAEGRPVARGVRDPRAGLLLRHARPAPAVIFASRVAAPPIRPSHEQRNSVPAAT